MAYLVPVLRGKAVAGMGGIVYLLRDEFTTDLAAGSVDGTAAEPGPGTRTVVDTDGDALSISGGLLTFTNPNSVWGDPGIYYDAVTRAAGRVLLIQLTPSAINTRKYLGFDLDQAGVAGENVFAFFADVRPYQLGSLKDTVADYTAATAYQTAMVLRVTGAYMLIKGGAFTNWTLLWVMDSGANTPLYPAITNHAGVLTFDYIRIPDVLWLPTPVAYDSFTRANGALGTSETSGPDAQTVTARTWNNRIGTTQIATNAASASALVGGIAIATVDGNTTDVLHSAELTRSAGNVGIVLRYADTSNYIYAIHDGTNAKLIKRVADAETTVITAVAAYAAGAVMVVICEGTTFSLFWNNAKIGATSTVSDAALQTGTEVGLYSSNTGNSQDDMTTFPRGSGNEYSSLDDY